MESNMLKEFTVDSHSSWLLSTPFGGGWTRETTPEARGWRLRPIGNGNVAVLGRKSDVGGKPGGKPGCFSIMVLSDGRFDVAEYDELTPKELQEQLLKGRVAADAYRQLKDIPGWALVLIQDVETREARSAR